jgi:hypothetical protein
LLGAGAFNAASGVADIEPRTAGSVGGAVDVDAVEVCRAGDALVVVASGCIRARAVLVAGAFDAGVGGCVPGGFTFVRHLAHRAADVAGTAGVVRAFDAPLVLKAGVSSSDQGAIEVHRAGDAVAELRAG